MVCSTFTGRFPLRRMRPSSGRGGTDVPSEPLRAGTRYRRLIRAAALASLTAWTAPAAQTASATVFESTTPGGELHVSVTLEPSPATCAQPVVLTVSATTLPDYIVAFGPDPTSEEHLELSAVTRSDTLTAEGRMITRSLQTSWQPSLPGRTRVTGRRVVTTAPDGRRHALKVPDTPIEILAVIPAGMDADIRDIASAPPLPVSRWRERGVVIVLVALVVALALKLFDRVRCARCAKSPEQAQT